MRRPPNRNRALLLLATAALVAAAGSALSRAPGTSSPAPAALAGNPAGGL